MVRKMKRDAESNLSFLNEYFLATLSVTLIAKKAFLSKMREVFRGCGNE